MKHKENVYLLFQCETVLEIDPNNVKAYYRRGTSQLESGEPNAALKDFLKVFLLLRHSNREHLNYFLFNFKVQELEPDNKAALNQITICRQAIKHYNEKQKKLYANMFSKFADSDNKVCWITKWFD